MRNSSHLPLTFVFELSEGIPVCSLVRDELQKVCGTGRYHNIMVTFSLMMFVDCGDLEQSMLPVGSIHINQLIAKRKAEREGKEIITDKWRLVVSRRINT